MEREEILDILGRMNALPKDIDTQNASSIQFDILRLVEDPIVTNRIAVEALQQLPRNYKFDVVLAANEESKLLAFAVATAAWARFAYADFEQCGGLTNGFSINKDEKVLIIESCVDESTSFEQCIDLIESKHAKCAGAISIVSLGNAAPLPENYYPLLQFN
jgi:orotate phosphoribosyltransferase